MLTHKEVVINNVIIHTKRGKQFNEVRPIMTGTDKVSVLLLFKACCVYCCMTSDESVSDKPTCFAPGSLDLSAYWSESFLYNIESEFTE